MLDYLYVFIILKMQSKFCINQILITIPSINSYFLYNLKIQKNKIQKTLNFKHFLDEIVINL